MDILPKTEAEWFRYMRGLPYISKKVVYDLYVNGQFLLCKLYIKDIPNVSNDTKFMFQLLEADPPSFSTVFSVFFPPGVIIPRTFINLAFTMGRKNAASILDLYDDTILLDFAKLLVSNYGTLIKYLKRYKQNREVVFAAVTQNARAIKYVDKKFADDDEIAAIVMKNAPDMYAYLSPRIRSHLPYMIAAVHNNPYRILLPSIKSQMCLPMMWAIKQSNISSPRKKYRYCVAILKALDHFSNTNVIWLICQLVLKLKK